MDFAKLSGNLAKVFELIKGNDLNEQKLEKIGQVFRDTAARTPGYFKRGPEIPYGKSPEQAIDFINRKHGTDFNYEPRAGDGMLDMHIADNGISAGTDSWMTSPSDRPGQRRFLIDSTDAGQGTGTGKRMYPAMWEFMLSQPGLYDKGFALSPNNLKRRALNMAPGVEKYGDVFGRRVQLDTGQLPPVPTLLDDRAALYHAISPEGKAGVLNSIGATNTADWVDRVNRAARQNLGGPMDSPGLTENVRNLDRLGLYDGKPWDPTTDVDPRHFEDLKANLMGASRRLSMPMEYGQDSLKRAAITNDAFNRGLVGGDLDPKSVQGLGWKAGGAVRPRTQGALSQMCQCKDR